MPDDQEHQNSKQNDTELQEWRDSFNYVLSNKSREEAENILEHLQIQAKEAGLKIPFSANTPYINTIPLNQQPAYPGNRDVERRIKSIIRWNAMAMVVRANKNEKGIGGHISSYASAATLYEVGFNHFFRAPKENFSGDMIFFQGHSSPGIYARAYLEGRLTEKDLENFRRELKPEGGLSSYPHPWLMPDFWQFPTVSMGLGPITAIYLARFQRYLEDRGLKPKDDAKIWAFLGDGETDEPESLGAITMASREHLDNLIFVVNCNLQRLDGPVRGNGKIIQELEAIFTGAGWNVIKALWGSDWDPLFEKDTEGLLAKRMGDIVDGQLQKYSVSTGEYIRKDFFGVDERLLKMVEHLSDEQIKKMRRGGHDPEKVYAAYKAAIDNTGTPTVILAQTIKGYGLGESGEGKNITHQQKKLNEQELKEFRSRFDIPLSDNDVAKMPFFRPADKSEEMTYLKERLELLGGSIPQRREDFQKLQAPNEDIFKEFYEGTGDHEVSSTMAYVRILSKLLKDPNIGKYIVPIIPDEARTFGMEALFRQCGIYSHPGQKYEPVDKESLLYYKETTDGQILEEGINEAGAMSSFIAAATSYSTFGIQTIPFYTYYSMFGPQRVGDLIWLAADMQARGFLVGGTSGRTTLNGEGLQHQDGHSPLLLASIPTCKVYDPAFAYELAVIIKDGIKRMFIDQEKCFYYISVANENYCMPKIPNNVEEGILKGLYRFKKSTMNSGKLKAHLFGSGSIIHEVLEAQKILEDTFRISTDVWSVTSYNELRHDAMNAERHNVLNPLEDIHVPYVTQILQHEQGVFVAASDYIKALPDGIGKWVPGHFHTLGTDGFGRSDTRADLRDFFEIDAKHIAFAAIAALFHDKKIGKELVQKAERKLKINKDKKNPMTS